MPRKKGPMNRIKIDVEISEALKNRVHQVRESLGEYFDVSERLVANFILMEGADKPLTEAALDKIKIQNFDPVKMLKKATQEAIAAKRNGHQVDIAEFIKKLQTPHSIKNLSSKTKPKAPKNSPLPPGSSRFIQINPNATKGTNPDHSKAQIAPAELDSDFEMYPPASSNKST